MIDLVDGWHRQGHQVWFISGAFQIFHAARLAWLREVAKLAWVESANLWLNPQSPEFDLGAGFKPWLATRFGLNVFVEDYPDTLHKITNQEMMVKFLLVHPYNSGSNGQQIVVFDAAKVSDQQRMQTLIEETSLFDVAQY